MSTTTANRAVPDYPLDGRRGHKLLTVELAGTLPPLRATDGQGLSAIARVKLFTPLSDRTILVTEGQPDPDFGWELYGLTVTPTTAEWGYLSLQELATARALPGRPGEFPAVERDCWFDAGRTLREVLADPRESVSSYPSIQGWIGGRS